MAEELVLTPGGLRPRSLVQVVEEGQSLRAVDGIVYRVDAADGADFKALVTRSALSSKALQFENTAALGSGWIAYAYWGNGTGDPISYFATTWVVPPVPATQSGQIIFLFNGIQNYGANYGILQPVLQWGVSAAGGGPYWAVANWYVTSGGQALHTPLVQVDPGDELTGVMRLTGESDAGYDYSSGFIGIGAILSVQNIAELSWANETLEAYNVSQCSDYPNTDLTAFVDIGLKTTGGGVPLNWTPQNAVTDCGQGTTVVSNDNPGGEVDIAYR